MKELRGLPVLLGLELNGLDSRFNRTRFLNMDDARKVLLHNIVVLDVSINNIKLLHCLLLIRSSGMLSINLGDIERNFHRKIFGNAEN